MGIGFDSGLAWGSRVWPAGACDLDGDSCAIAADRAPKVVLAAIKIIVVPTRIINLKDQIFIIRNPFGGSVGGGSLTLFE